MASGVSPQGVLHCHLCETSVVEMYCNTCLMNLCKACVGEHFSSNLSKQHEIVDFNDRNTILTYPKCNPHDVEICEMHCKQCLIPVCGTCIASDQHQGHTFMKILQVFHNKKENIKKDREDLNDIIYPTYQDIISDVKNKMIQLIDDHENLSSDITKQRKVWHTEIDELVDELESEIEEKKESQLQIFLKHLDDRKQKMSAIKDEINSIDVVLNSTNISEVFSALPKVDEYNTLPAKIMLTVPEFSPSKLREDHLFSFKPGNLSLKEDGYKLKMKSEAGSSFPVKHLLDEPETLTVISTGYTHNLYSVACLSSEEIWTRGTDSDTMKLYSINQGSLLKSIKTKSKNTPTDIAVTKTGNLVYTDHSDRTVNTVKNDEIKEVFKLQNWKPRFVCIACSGELLVMMNNDYLKKTKVIRYFGSSEDQSIQYDENGMQLFSSEGGSYFIRENRNLDICVADFDAKVVVVVNMYGKLRFKYTGRSPAPKSKPFSPTGITTDSQSHILTADFNNDCVHIIDQDGQFLRYIDCQLNSPLGLSIDKDDNLFVAEHFKNKVKKIKYQQ